MQIVAPKPQNTNTQPQKNSFVTCCVPPVTCHLSLTLPATVTEPPPPKPPTRNSEVVYTDPKTKKKIDGVGPTEKRTFHQQAPPLCPKKKKIYIQLGYRKEAQKLGRDFLQLAIVQWA